jgi:hypothetical protein
MHLGFLVGKSEGERPLGRPRNRVILLTWFLEKYDGGVLAGFIWLRIGTNEGRS